MRNIKYIAIHCAATKPSMDVPISRIKKWHLARNFSDVGYHYYVRRDGTLEFGRPLDVSGAHVKGYNSVSVGICYEGGIDEAGEPEDNRTDRQKARMLTLIKALKHDFPQAIVKGHRDFSKDKNGDGEITEDEWMKECPCFPADEEYSDLKIYNKDEEQRTEG